jgi:hypothetical protein
MLRGALGARNVGLIIQSVPKAFLRAASMATPYHIQVGVKDTGLLKINQVESAAAKASDLLQKDLEVRDFELDLT